MTTAAAPKKVQLGSVRLSVVPPPGYRYITDAPTLKEFTNVTTPGRQVLLGCIKASEIPAMSAGATRPWRFASLRISDQVVERDVTGAEFAKLKRITAKEWNATMQQMKASVMKDAEKKNPEFKRKYGISLDNSKATMDGIGVIDEGKDYITTGLVSTGTKVSGAANYSVGYLHLSVSLLVRKRLLFMLVAVPVKSAADIKEAKTTAAQWVQAMRTHNP